METYQLCNPKFVYSDQYNPKRYLTHPSVGVSNNGYDNVNHDFILYFGGTLVNEDGTRRSEILSLLSFPVFLLCSWLGSDDCLGVPWTC